METKLSRFCDKIIEAGWLAALIAVPLFFNIYSSRVFEPDKITLLRSIALVMIAAWIIGKIETLRLGEERIEDEGASPSGDLWGRIRGIPLLIPVLLVVLSYLVATLFSMTPRISLFGSYVRLQGISTTFSYIVIFFLILERMRTRTQLERALHAIILTSVPASLYGILQHYRLDPLPWAGDVVERVSSTMGNPIFIAAYLLMVFFLTLYKALQVFGRLTSAEENSLRDAVLGGVYLFILAIQLIAIFFTQSRGPWLGLLGGLYAFVLIMLVGLRQRAKTEERSIGADLLPGVGMGAGTLAIGGIFAWIFIGNLDSPMLGLAVLGAAVVLPYAALIVARKGLHWLWVSWIAQTLLVAGFLVVFNLPQTPLESLRETPYIGRLGQVFQTDTGTGKVRVLIWEGAAKMVAANPLRALVGYGPESMYVTYEPFYPPDLAHYEERNRTPDRSHNQTFDALVSTGIFGFLAYMFLFSSIFYYGLRWLGLIRSDRSRNLFIAFIAGGAALGALLSWLLTGGFAFLGVSVPAGFIVGLVLYLVIAAVNVQAGAEGALTGERRLLVTALMAALLGHFIEIHFGFVVASTGTYFWALAALFVLVGMGRIREQEAQEPAPIRAKPVRHEKGKRRKQKRRQLLPAQAAAARAADRSPWASFWSHTLIVVLVLAVVAFTFTSNQARQTSIAAILWDSLTKIGILSGQTQGSVGLLMLIFLTALAGGVFTFYEVARSQEKPLDAGWYAKAIPAFLAAIFLVPLVVAAAKADLIQIGKDVSGIIARWYVLFFALLFALAAALPRTGAPQAKALRKETSWAYPLLLVAAGFVIWSGNGVLVKADMLYQQGYMLEQDYMKNAGQLNTDQRVRVLNQVLSLYKRAVKDAPREDFYYLAMARVYQQMAPLVEDPNEKIDLLAEGIATVEKARAIYPLNVDHTANMGRMYRTWAEAVTDSEEKREKLSLAAGYYDQAVKLSPNKAHLYNEWALTYYLMGDYGMALEKLEYSLSLDAEYDQTYFLLGQVYVEERSWALAEQAFRKATEFAPKSIEALSMLGYSLDQQGRFAEAIEANLRVLELSPRDYITIRNLSVLYNKQGETDQALAYAKLALSLAPEKDKPQLEQFVSQLEAAQNP